MIRILLLTTLALVALNGPWPAHGQIAVEAWAQRFSFTGASSFSMDESQKIAVDASGNVIVAGSSNARITDYDWLIIKYSGAGVPLWTNRYNGTANGADRAVGVAVDGSGNVFVTGNSASTNVSPYNFDYVTIKYSGAGVPLWTNRYNGPGNSDDLATALAVDASGNVFVTGSSANTTAYPYNYDYATIKYSGAGVALWTNRYNGAAYSDDLVNDVAVDSSGNVIVTGQSGSDYATIKYSGAGMPLWTNLYNGPLNTYDYATALAVDGSGNVIVTGYSTSVSDYDYATIKYSDTGVPLWTNRYNGPGNGYDYALAIAVDGSGSVFVTGSSYGNGSGDFATIKYSGAGVPLWTNRYSGSVYYSDSALAVVVDGSGNVFVTGYSENPSGGDSNYVTTKYSGAGVGLWTNRATAGKALALDGSGNAFVFGRIEGYFEFETIAYSGAGAMLWTNTYRGSGNNADIPRAVAVGSNGNVYVTGSSYDLSGSDDFTTIAYSPAGVPLWTNYYDGPGEYHDDAIAVATDSGGNVFVTGISEGWSSGQDFATIKYSSNGVPLWTNRYNGPGNSSDGPAAMAVDSSGNVIVTGLSSSSSVDIATIKYSGAGVALWTNYYNNPQNGDDFPVDVAVDNGGNIFVTGYFTASGTFDYATIKYSGAGVALWTNHFNGTYVPAGLALDGGGNAFVAGPSGVDTAIIKISGAGVTLWTNHQQAAVAALATDGAGNVFVTGQGVGPIRGYATIKYSNAGTPLWTNYYNGPGTAYGFNDNARAVAVDGSGNVIVTGQSYSDDSSTSDYVTVAYSNAGVPLWTNRYNGPANGDDLAITRRSLAIGPNGSVVVTGGSDGDYTSGSTSDFATVKYVIVPLLNIVRAAPNTVAISWPSPSTGFTLQQNTNSIATLNWSNVLTTPTDNGTTKTVIVNPASGDRFFRLKSP